jgi:hypothetical protein
MQKHHEKLVGLFEAKIREAENIVAAIIEENGKEKLGSEDLKS